MNKCNKWIIIILLILTIPHLCFAYNISDRPRNIENLRNYIILLVHGTGDNGDCFRAVQEYLDKPVTQGGLGLEKRVFRYSFSDKFGNIKTWSKELKQWFSRAQADFRDKNNNSTPPSQFILICHSAGGLAARYYVMGKDENGLPLYEGNVKKIIMVDTPNLGSSAGEAAIFAETHRGARFGVPLAMVASSLLIPMNEQVSAYLAADAAWAITSGVLTEVAFSALDRHAHQPIVNDQKPGSDFLTELNYSLTAIPGTFEAPFYSIIAGKGVPTPSWSSDLALILLNSDIFTKIAVGLSSGLTNGKLTTYEERISSMNLTLMSGYPFLDDGDLVGTVASQKGEGISSLSGAKRYEYAFTSPSIAAIFTAADATITALYYIYPQLSFFAGFGVALGYGCVAVASVDAREYFNAHVTMKDKIIIEHQDRNSSNGLAGVKIDVDLNSPTMLEEAIFDQSFCGATSSSALNQQPFILSTNLTNESGTIRTLSAYTPVSIESMTENTNPASIGVLIIINGKEKNISTFMVKEPPTRIEGVLRDFMPKYMQYFQYSENFSAWKDIKILDEWGRFQIDGLKLAEGQNVIDFRAKNKVGYTSNQILNITVNTIPMLATNIRPLSGTYTNNSRPKFSGVFSKASYSEATLEAIGLDFAKLICGTKETDVKQNIIFKISGGPYDKHGAYEFVPPEPLPDGKYSFVIGVKSNVGSARVISEVVVDTVAPGIMIKGSR